MNTHWLITARTNVFACDPAYQLRKRDHREVTAVRSSEAIMVKSDVGPAPFHYLPQLPTCTNEGTFHEQ